MPVPLPYMRPVPTAPMAHPVQHPGQFVRLNPDHSGVMNGARGNNSGELQKVREEFEAGKPWCFEWRAKMNQGTANVLKQSLKQVTYVLCLHTSLHPTKL